MRQLLLSNDWMSWWDRAKWVLRKKVSIIPFVGGLIISAALHVNAHLNEQLQQAESIARSAESLRDSARFGYASLTGIRATLHQVAGRSAPDQQGLVSYKEVEGLYDESTLTTTELKALEENLQEVEALADQIPGRPAAELERKRYVDLRNDLADAKKQNDDERQCLSRIERRNVAGVQMVALRDVQHFQDLYVIRELHPLIGENGVEMEAEVLLINANGWKKLLEIKKRMLYGPVTYLLYGVGMILTLSGKLFGSDKNSAEGVPSSGE